MITAILRKETSMERKFRNLCSPLTVGRTVFRNRIGSAPMGGTDISNDGCTGDASITNAIYRGCHAALDL